MRMLGMGVMSIRRVRILVVGVRVSRMDVGVLMGMGRRCGRGEMVLRGHILLGV